MNKYSIKRLDSKCKSWLSRTKKRKIKYSIAAAILFIIAISTIHSTPLTSIKFEIKNFSIEGEHEEFRTNTPIRFHWDITGVPQRALLVLGDGHVINIEDKSGNNNGWWSGELLHSYVLQGRYTPILKVWNSRGRPYTKALVIVIQNNPPLFNIAIDGKISSNNNRLKTAAFDYEAYEDEEILISVEGCSAPNHSLTYIFSFADAEIKTTENFTIHSWKNAGTYPVTITVIGSTNELSKETVYIRIKNKPPIASFSIENEDHIAIGSEIKFSADSSIDTPSDLNSLRYVWDWGDNSFNWGKYATHTYFNSGIYNISLTVKDDDGAISSFSRMIELNNTLPHIDFIDSNITHIINEGEPYLFTAKATDDSIDIVQLLYYWNFDSTNFDPLALGGFEQGGYLNRHVFTDDYKGHISVVALDPSGEYSVATTNVEVLNVAPQVSIYEAKILANVTFQVFRNDSSVPAAFIFQMVGNNKSITKTTLDFINSTESMVEIADLPFGFSLLKDWEIIVNSTEMLTNNSWFQVFTRLAFVNGQELILESPRLFGGDYGYWQDSISSYFYNFEDFSFSYPITFNTQLYDPSSDDVQYSLQYIENKLLEITCTNALPITSAFIIDDIEYNMNIFEQDLIQFANITAEKLVYSELFEKNSFPFKKELTHEIYPLIDISEILENVLKLKKFDIIRCLNSNNYLEAEIIDDDLGQNELSVSFNTTKEIEFSGLIPRINSSIDLGSEPVAYGYIKSFLPTAYEGERVKLISRVDKNLNGLNFMWDFGDGYLAYTQHTQHAWQHTGVYNITLTIADAFGNIHRDIKNITILSKAPEILGPFAFQGLEGQALTLDMEIYDSESDEPFLKYFWYDEANVVLSTEKCPTMVLNDGEYIYTLVVEDPSGHISTKQIKIVIHPLSPEVLVSSYMYYGVAGEIGSSNDNGIIILRAYGTDSVFDNDELIYHWKIRDGTRILNWYDYDPGSCSEVFFKCKRTTVYLGEVHVIDPEGNEKMAVFEIHSTVDSSLDGITDEAELMFKISGNSTSDADGDGLSDNYEQTVSNTSYLDPDTDGDGLWDGYNVNVTKGELSMNTDALDWDSDNDFLSDGTEIYGWNITVVYFENSSTFHIDSDALSNDTDSDGLPDYDEYYKGCHPRQSDTDNDDLSDDIDPFVSKWDGDEDLLSDYDEIQIGTNYNNTDTDSDGLKDGEEVFGWGIGFYTNPLDADSDHDFVSDSAEIKHYFYNLKDEGFDDLDKKVNLTNPVTLHFPHNFEQASAAQISFGISFGEFGEFNSTSSYGVANESVYDISIIITKKDDGIVLANFTTNSTRYFSQVIDITDIMNDEELDYNYHGDYEIAIGYPLNATTPGDYYGTYFGPNFEFPETDDWINCTGAGCHLHELAWANGHTDVLILNDTDRSQNAYMQYDDGQYKGHGTVLFYFMITGHLSSYGPTYIFSANRKIYPYGAFYFTLDNGKWKCRDGNDWIVAPNIPDPELDQWYAIQIDWCRDSTAWKGLGNKKWQITIDGVCSGTLDYNKFNNIDPNYFRFFTTGTDSADYAIYYDALSFSWDEGYNEGKFLASGVAYKYIEEGTYLATYSFDNDYNDAVPSGWTDSSGDGCFAKVIQNSANHEKVLHLHDDSQSNIFIIENEFDSTRESGTVEMWVRGTFDDFKSHYITLVDDAGQNGVFLRIYGGKLEYKKPDHTFGYICLVDSETWYHVRLDFECGNGQYLGLAADKFYCWVDGTKKGPYSFNTALNSVNRSKFSSYSYHTGVDIYVDAVGYSWDPQYTIGDNKYDISTASCYLEYFELDFCRYLNPNCADTDGDGIMDGVEMGILVRGNDTIDFRDAYMPYYDNITELSYYNLTINQCGDYEGTYSFEYDENGAVPSGWNMDADTSCNATVIEALEDHHKVLSLSDYSNSGTMELMDTFNTTMGVVEFWIASDDVSKPNYIYLYEDAIRKMAIAIQSSKFQYYSGSSWIDVGKTAQDDLWYHVKLEFNCSTDKWNIYIDKEQLKSNLSFESTAEYISNITLLTSNSYYGYCGYYDAIGYSWHWNYEIGDNLHDTNGVSIFESENYFGTYFGPDFEFPETNDWINSTGTGCHLHELNCANGHTDVLILNDTDRSQNAYMQYDDGQYKGHGTVLFYFMITGHLSSYGATYIFDGCRKVYPYGAFYFTLDNGKWKCKDGNDWIVVPNIPDPELDQWYAVQIDWCRDSTAWKGLGNKKYRITVDGVSSGALDYNKFNNIDPNYFRFFTTGTDSADYAIYYDALSFSWDAGYCESKCLTQEWQINGTIQTDDYYLEIPQTGKVYDAELYLELKSNETLNGQGAVIIQVLKEEINCTIDDVQIFEYISELNASEQFTYQKSINLTNIVNDELITEIYGTYVLKIGIYDTILTDIFNLTRFEIVTDTYIQAGFQDKIAWTTDPAENDTDGDGWSDYYEIFTSETSPLSKDSDGDDAWDSNDRDPLGDVMLEIYPYFGAYRNLHIFEPRHAVLQIVMQFAFGENDYYFNTPSTWSYLEPNIYGKYQAAYFDEHYYVNIDDDITRQGDNVTMNLQLWLICNDIGLWDTCDLSKDVNYTITDPDDPYETLHAEKIGFFGFTNELDVKVKTVVVERANTLAIYGVNDTFTGHYQDINQRYSLIQLHIPDENHFPGSNSFINEQIGNRSTDVNFVDSDTSTGDCYVEIVEDVGDHNRILKIHHVLSENVHIYHDLDSDQSYGTIEWWWRGGVGLALGSILYFDLRRDDTDMIRLYMTEGKIKYNDGTTHDIMSINANTWYRMRVDFESTTGNYKGLSQYRFDLYVDGVLKVNDGQFANNEGHINRIGIDSGGIVGFDAFFDAFGFSWDSEYNLGDNAEAMGDCDGTPFELGVNVIVIPTELFTHTLLNEYVETECLNETVLYSARDNMFEFTANDRDDSVQEGNADVDYVFIRFDITPEQAMEVLNLILIGIINETLNENNNTIAINGTIHAYVSTKLNGTLATQMNLPYSVLSYVPWFNNYSNSPFGPQPNPEVGWDSILWAILWCIPGVNIVLYVMMAICPGIFMINLLDFLAEIFMNLLSFLAYLLWVIVRCALFIFFFILLALELLTISVVVLSIGVALLFISIFEEIETSFGLNWAITYGSAFRAGYFYLKTSSTNFQQEFWIEWVYWEFLDLYIPWVSDKTIYGNSTVYMSQNGVLDSDNKLTTLGDSTNNPIPLEPASDNVAPTLHCEYVDLGNDKYDFRTNYYDPNFEGPDDTYGVKLHLIKPDGSQLDSFDMSLDGGADFTSVNGAIYNKTVDLSGYNDGLWHFYFSTKDKDTSEIITSPLNDYFVGPDTSNGPSYLMGHRVTSNTADYSNIDGWITENFTFYVTWWDMVDGNAPSEVSLCLIPAKAQIGTGVSKTVGIQKFEMESVEFNPDYEDPVEFHYTLNFDDEGYDDSNIGAFKYYFEATTTSGEITSLLSIDESGNFTHFIGPFVKSTTKLNFRINSYASYGDGTTITRESSNTYIVEVSDYSGTGLSSKPNITCTQDQTKGQFTMLHYWSSTDGKIKRYYFEATTDKLSYGYWDVDFEFEYQGNPYSLESGICLDLSYIKSFFSQPETFYAEGRLMIDFTLAFLGIVPITLLSAVALWGCFNDLAYILSFIPLVITGLFMSLMLTKFYETDNIGGLLGFSLGCFLLWICIETFMVNDDGDINSFASIIVSGLLGPLKFLLALQWIFALLIPLLRLFLPDDSAVSNVLSFAHSVLLLFPMFIGVYAGLYTLLVAHCVSANRSKRNSYWKFWYRCTRIYKIMILVGIFVGIFLATIKNLSLGGSPPLY